MFMPEAAGSHARNICRLKRLLLSYEKPCPQHAKHIVSLTLLGILSLIELLRSDGTKARLGDPERPPKCSMLCDVELTNQPLSSERADPEHANANACMCLQNSQPQQNIRETFISSWHDIPA